MQKKALKLAFLICICLLVAFSTWRWKAPASTGQNLLVTLPASDTFEILLLGDMGTGNEQQKRIAAAMERHCLEHPLSAVLFLGDNFYPVGVESTEDAQWKSKFSDVYNSDCLKKLPFYALLGNHDYKGSPEAQIQYRSQEPPLWHMPHRFYELTFGQRLQLIMLDTNILDLCGFAEFCTLDFLRSAMQRPGMRDRIVLGHHPIISASGKYQEQTFQGNLLSSLLCDEASSYIAGHSHHLEHRSLSDCSTDAFIVGGGGADLYDVKKDDPASHFVASQHGFMSLRVHADGLDFTFYDADLTPIYKFKRSSPQR